MKLHPFNSCVLLLWLLKDNKPAVKPRRRTLSARSSEDSLQPGLPSVAGSGLPGVSAIQNVSITHLGVNAG